MPTTLEQEKVDAEGLHPLEQTHAPSSGNLYSERRLAPWHELPVSARLRILRRARHLLAQSSDLLVDAIPANLPRTRADSLVAEVLPLLAALKFLEQEAKHILAPRRLGRRGLPFWLSGVSTTVERVPLGSILILAPYNYPLLLAGVQTVQALAAGNSVVWKPGRAGKTVADLFARILTQAGLPDGVLRITDESVRAAEEELALRPAKILFTGSAHTGRQILHAAAETLTPVTAELSGCDAVLVLPTANPQTVADALLFGMRLNGSETCMAPRRLILIGSGHLQLLATLQQALAQLPSVPTAPPAALLADARRLGATVHGTPGQPYFVLNATPEMAITHSDIFYPVLSVLRADTPDDAIALHNQSRLSLTAAIFGDAPTAQHLAQSLTTATILINDLIVPTADPRIPFGGRGDSGFGVTRGREGLLELTAAKTTSTRRNKNYRHLQPTTSAHEPLFTGLIEFTHAGTWRARFAGLQKLVQAARNLPR